MADLQSAWRVPAKFEGTLRVLTTAQRDNLPAPSTEILIFNSTTAAIECYSTALGAWFALPDSISLTEIGYLDGVTAGTVTASKAVVVDANKDVASFRDITVRNLDAGASGTAGTVDVFPATASKGKLSIDVTDQTGNTTVTHRFAAMGQATVVTVPDPGAAAASHVLTEGAQTLNGVKTFGSGVAFGAGATFDADHAAVAATGNDTTQTATVTKAWGTITTGALTTAAGGSTDIVLTLTGVAAGDPVFVTKAGGTNTRTIDDYSVVTTTNTITITIRNIDLINALNGTIKFYYFWMKA